MKKNTVIKRVDRVGFFAQLPKATIKEIHRRAETTKPKRKTWEVVADAFVTVKAAKAKKK